MKKGIRLLGTSCFLVLLLLTAGHLTPARADSGWQRENPEEENSAWIYLLEDGSYLQNAWKKSGSQYYYLDENGRMAVDTFIEYEGDTYYVDADGVRATRQWASMPDSDNALGEFVDTVYYYFDSVGKALKNCKKTINGSIYIFDEEGRMLSGWQTYGDDNDLYYLGNGEEGWAYTGWHHLEPDPNGPGGQGDMKWFYFHPRTGKAYRDARKQINGSYYQFDSSGAMEEKWITGTPDDANWHGTASTSSAWYTEGSGSQGVGWVYTYAPDDRNEEHDKEWYYLDSKGVPFNEHAKDTHNADDLNNDLAIRVSDNTYIYGVAAKVIKNKTYLFDENGKMMTGLYFLNNVKRAGSSDLGNEMIGDDYYVGGSYYFNDSEGSKRGQMMTGRQTIDFDGEKRYYHFRNNGMAYAAIIVDGYLYGLDGSRFMINENNVYEPVPIQPPTVIKEKGNDRVHTDCQVLLSKNSKLVKSGTVKADGIKYTVQNYKIIKTETY